MMLILMARCFALHSYPNIGFPQVQQATTECEEELKQELEGGANGKNMHLRRISMRLLW